MMVIEKRIIQTIGAFLLFGTVMALLARVTLLFPGTLLDEMWVVNPIAHTELLPFAKMARIGFLFLSPLLTFAGCGLLRFKQWGWTMAVLIIGTNAAGDIVNIWRGELLKGLVGAVIALAILLYLLSPPVKKYFVQ